MAAMSVHIEWIPDDPIEALRRCPGSLSRIARQIGVVPSMVTMVVRGQRKSRRVLSAVIAEARRIAPKPIDLKFEI
jgi:hypothetical protein